MSEKKDNPGLITAAMCEMKHTALLTRISGLEKDITDIKIALVGEPFKGGGLVEAVKDLKKHSLSGRDKAFIIAALISALAAIVVAWLK